MVVDSANAYELHATEFLGVRDRSTIGAEIVQLWAGSLTSGTEVIEIACGGGFPVTRALEDSGLRLWAIDASPTLVTEFLARFPNVPTRCERAQDSDFFARKYGAAISIGFIFLLNEPDQLSIIHRVSEILLPRSRFLITAPVEVGTWADASTGHECRSLGRDMYESAFNASGFRLIVTHEDEGNNNYYEVERVAGSTP